MNDTICGHDRDTLGWALCAAVEGSSAPNGFDLPALAAKGATLFPDLHMCEASLAMAAIGDPAKLAEMLASEGRRLGAERMFVAIASENIIHAHVRPTEIHRLLIPQARALLLRWIGLPDGAKDQAERALCGNDGI